MIDLNNLSDDVLKDIGNIIVKYLNKEIAHTYPKEDHVSFGQFSSLLNQNIGISYYPESNTFHGNVDAGGHFSGTVIDKVITITCSQSSNSITLNID